MSAMISIAIDTTTDVCSAALFHDNELLGERIDTHGHNHATQLSVFINELLNEYHVTPQRVILSQGPGSYTGLRIGAATAKGLCFGYDIPLLPISTLQLIAAQADINAEVLCPMIDARRMEVYTALLTPSLQFMSNVSPMIIDNDSFRDILEHHRVVFCGNGAAKCKSVITHPNASFAEDVVPLARNSMKVVKSMGDNIQLVEGKQLAYYEPFYLKEFQATVSKNKLW